MSDSSSYSNTSDLNDIHDIELVMQVINQDQKLKGESSRRTRNAINRELDVAEARLMADYFGEPPKYLDYYFRHRYRMNRSLFLEIVQGIKYYIKTVDHLPGHFKFFVVRPDATGLMSFSVIMKCTSVICQLAYAEFLRKPDMNDTQTLYDHTIAFIDYWECYASLIACSGNGLIVQKHGTGNLGEGGAVVVVWWWRGDAVVVVIW
nr:hypothetical protein [Tanacetum cinerariifolium]